MYNYVLLVGKLISIEENLTKEGSAEKNLILKTKTADKSETFEIILSDHLANLSKDFIGETIGIKGRLRPNILYINGTLVKVSEIIAERIISMN